MSSIVILSRVFLDCKKPPGVSGIDLARMAPSLRYRVPSAASAKDSIRLKSSSNCDGELMAPEAALGLYRLYYEKEKQQDPTVHPHTGILGATRGRYTHTVRSQMRTPSTCESTLLVRFHELGPRDRDLPPTKPTPKPLSPIGYSHLSGPV